VRKSDRGLSIDEKEEPMSAGLNPKDNEVMKLKKTTILSGNHGKRSRA
jgi:hypothetical protein